MAPCVRSHLAEECSLFARFPGKNPTPALGIFYGKTRLFGGGVLLNIPPPSLKHYEQSNHSYNHFQVWKKNIYIRNIGACFTIPEAIFLKSQRSKTNPLWTLNVVFANNCRRATGGRGGHFLDSKTAILLQQRIFQYIHLQGTVV